MKQIALITTLILTVFIFSCQKELYFDDVPSSEGTLKEDSAGLYCLPSAVYGVYKQDSILGNSNYIEVDVNVTRVGDYTIISIPNDGMTFSAQGNFTSTGINRVKLLGAGLPRTSGAHQIQVTYNSTSCIIDLDVQSSNPIINAVFSLGGAPNNCSGFVLSGNYNSGIAMDNSNTASVNITTTTPGIYSITSDTVNGVYFNASGTLTSVSNNIVLVANGTPINTGTYNYTLTNDIEDCSFSVTYIGPSTYTISSTSGICTSVTAQGTYTSGIPTDASNFINTSVNVNNPGYYIISTDTINGIYFSASGNFTTTGPQSITLFANGTPINASPYPFEYHLYNSNASSFCSFTVNVSGDYIVCEIDGQRVFFNMGTNLADPTASATLIGLTGFPILSIKGLSVFGSSTPSFNIKLNNASNTIGVGTYTTVSVPSNGFITCDYIDATNNNYFIFQNPPPATPAFTLNITNSQVRYQGTFSGILQNSSGSSMITITNGVFDIPFR
jgi:hypothetical protein